MATIQEILDRIQTSKSNNINNNSFIELMQQISGNPEDDISPVNDTDSIYGHIVQMYTTLYGGSIDYSTISENIDILQALYDELNAGMLSPDGPVQEISDSIIPNLAEILAVNENAAIAISAKDVAVSTKNEVEVMKLAVETIYDTFDDRFLGTYAESPLVDNDGDPLTDGAMYFNNSSNTLNIYDVGMATWIAIPQMYLSTLLDVELTSITTGDILTWNGTKWINTRDIKADSVQLNGGTGTDGTMSWNEDEGTIDIQIPGGSTIQIGQENIRKVRNSTGSTIDNGTVVMFSGTIGNSGRIKVEPFTAGFNEASFVYGLSTQNISAGNDGVITISGKVRGIDTTGTSVGETWSDEDILYPKPNDAGKLTNIEPADDELKIEIATVIHAHTNGTLEVRTLPFNLNATAKKANKLAIARNLAATGDISWNVNFDGGADATGSADLSETGVTAGEYRSVTVDAKGRITGGVNPTTTDNAVSRFNGTTGKVQDSNVTIADNGRVIIDDDTNDGSGGLEISSYKPIITLNDKSAGASTLTIEQDGGVTQFKKDATEIARLHTNNSFIIPAGVTLGTAAGSYNAANTLDDYEEGTFTLTPDFGTVTTANGKYTKVGNLVTVTFSVSSFSDTTTASPIALRGLPFSASSSAVGSLMIRYVDVGDNLIAYISGTEINFFNCPLGTTWDRLKHSNLVSSSAVAYVAITYQTN